MGVLRRVIRLRPHPVHFIVRVGLTWDKGQPQRQETVEGKGASPDLHHLFTNIFRQ
jgi:hypothetical protein